MSYERLVVTAPIAKVTVEPAEIAPESPVVVPPPRYVPPDAAVKRPKYGAPPASTGIPVKVCALVDACDPADAEPKAIP